MKPILNLFYVSADKDKNSKIELADGTMLFLDTRFRPEELAVQEGRVEQIPARLKHPNLNKKWRCDSDLRIGDKVYFHHFTVTEQHKDESGFYQCSYDNLYCYIRDGKIEMIEDWVFVEPILEPEENIYSPSGLQVKPEREYIPLQGTIRHIHPYWQNKGLRPGDHVVFTTDSEYEITVEGKKYYRMLIQDLACRVEKDRIIPIPGTIVMEPEKIEDAEKNGILLKSWIQENLMRSCQGVVIASDSEEIEKGKTILYTKLRGMRFSYNSNDYIFLHERDALATL